MSAAPDTVLKLGGGILAEAESFTAAVMVIVAAARERRLLIVPGGGPFADTVRDVDRRIALSDDAAHWMAVLGMEQYAHLIASRLADAVLVRNASQIAGAFDVGGVPVLAPYRWLRQADPLPHSWDVTSDSIAAWLSGVVGARRLVLVKPRARRGDGLQGAGEKNASRSYDVLDPYFYRALPHHITPVIVHADQLDRLTAVLRESIEEER